MSKRSVAPQSKASPLLLHQVLSVGVGGSEPSVVDVKGVFISALPTQWSLITQAEYQRLDLTPETPEKYPSMADGNPCYAIVFLSPHANTYRFFVEPETPPKDRSMPIGERRWYALARPVSDRLLYARGEEGWACGS